MVPTNFKCDWTHMSYFVETDFYYFWHSTFFYYFWHSMHYFFGTTSLCLVPFLVFLAQLAHSVLEYCTTFWLGLISSSLCPVCTTFGPCDLTGDSGSEGGSKMRRGTQIQACNVECIAMHSNIMKTMKNVWYDIFNACDLDEGQCIAGPKLLKWNYSWHITSKYCKSIECICSKWNVYCVNPKHATWIIFSVIQCIVDMSHNAKQSAYSKIMHLLLQCKMNVD